MLGGLADDLAFGASVVTSVLTATKDPPLVFRFGVSIAFVPIAAFTECELPALEVETEEIKEGGLNTYTHQLVGRVKQGRVTLKHGIMVNDMLLTWYLQVMNGKLGESAMHTITIAMYSESFKPLYIFNFDRCVPVKWQGPSFKSSENAVAVESVEFVHHGVDVISLPLALLD